MELNEAIEYTNSSFNNFIHASEIPKIILRFFEESTIESSTYVLGCSDMSSSKEVLLKMKSLMESRSQLSEVGTNNSSYTMKIDKLMNLYRPMTVDSTLERYVREMKQLSVDD